MSPSHSNSRASEAADDALLRLIREGNEPAMHLLYERRGRMVYSLALSILRSIDDAEEVAQDVFLKIWRNAPGFDPARGSALAWITTMTRRTAIDRTRSKAYKAGGKNVPLEEAVGAAGSVSSDTPMAAVHAREVHDALEKLDDAHRDVIRMSYFEGLSHSQIANHLEAPVGTVKSRIREAVIKLRRLMDAG